MNRIRCILIALVMLQGLWTDACWGLLQESNNHSETIRQEFRDFYEPLIPELEKRFSGNRFQIAATNPMGNSIQVRYCQGLIDGPRFRFDRFKATRISRDNVSLEELSGQFRSDMQIEQSGGQLDDYCFLIDYRDNQKSLDVRFDQRVPRTSFPALIVAPTCSVTLGKSFHDILNDSSVTFLEFERRRLRGGEERLTLYYLPDGFSPEQVFEASFDPANGLCHSSLEFGDGFQSDPLIVQVEYSPVVPDGQLPSPLLINCNDPLVRLLAVLDYEPVADFDPSQISVTAYGFDESEVRRPLSLGDTIASNATSILLVIALVVLALFVFFLCLILIIGIFSRRSSTGSPASDDSAPDDLTG